MKEGRVPQPLINIKDGIFVVWSNKIQESFQKMVEEKVLLLKKRGDAVTDMKNHPKYYPIHCLIRCALEDCRGFKSWLHKVLKSVFINLPEEYFESLGTCYALTIKERYDNTCNRQDEEEEPQIIWACQ